MVVQPGPVVEFLLANQNVKDPYSVDWTKVQTSSFVLLNFHRCFSIFEKLSDFLMSSGETCAQESQSQGRSLKPRVQD